MLSLVSSLLLLLVALPILLILLLRAKPLPGIPHDQTPNYAFYGDIPALAAFMKTCKSPQLFIQSQAEKLGPICQLVLGKRTIVVISDPQEIEDMYGRRKIFERSSTVAVSFKGTVTGSQAPMMTDAVWKLHRRLFAPCMSSHYLKQMTPRIISGIDRFVELWEAKRAFLASSRSSASFDAGDDLVYLTMDTITNFTLGHDFGCLSSAIESVHSLPPIKASEQSGKIFSFSNEPPELFEDIRLLVTGLTSTATSLFPALNVFLSHLRPSWRKARAAVSRWIQHEIAQRKNERAGQSLTGNGIASRVKTAVEGVADDVEVDLQDESNCILTMVLNQGVEEKMPPRELEDELFGLLLAGQETTASVLKWTVKHLSHHPEVQRTLRAELMSLLSSTDLGVENNNGIPVLTYAAIISNQVPYLEAVVAESLRSAQVTPLTGRDTTEDTIILGHHVPKGQLITFASALSGDLNNRERAKAHPEFFIPPDSDSRSPTSRTPERKMGMWDKYTDRMEFAPERWLDYVKDANEKETRVYNAKKGYNFQFGAGVRGCFGKPVAILELKLVLAMISLAFFFDHVPEEVDGFGVVESLSIMPEHCFVNLKKWSDVERV